MHNCLNAVHTEADCDIMFLFLVLCMCGDVSLRPLSIATPPTSVCSLPESKLAILFPFIPEDKHAYFCWWLLKTSTVPMYVFYF